MFINNYWQSDKFKENKLSNINQAFKQLGTCSPTQATIATRERSLPLCIPPLHKYCMSAKAPYISNVYAASTTHIHTQKPQSLYVHNKKQGLHLSECLGKDLPCIAVLLYSWYKVLTCKLAQQWELTRKSFEQVERMISSSCAGFPAELQRVGQRLNNIIIQKVQLQVRTAGHEGAKVAVTSLHALQGL